MVLCSGVFDGLHEGHVMYLSCAAALCEEGEAMVVAVASDAYVRLHKGRIPKWNWDERSAVVEALNCVSFIVHHDDQGAAPAIRVLRPRLFVKGADWHQRGGIPADDERACMEVGAEVVYIEDSGAPHTSTPETKH